MISFATSLVTISTAVWVGAIVFQAAVVAPSVFATLEESQAHMLLRTLFPRFFRLGLACGSVMLASVLVLIAVEGGNSALAGLAGVVLIMLLLAGMALRMVPSINAARDAGAAGRTRFDRLHQLSVLLTVSMLALGVAVLIGLSDARLLGAGS